MEPIDGVPVVESPPAPLTTETAKTWVKDTAERVLSTAVQAFITFFVVSGSIDMGNKEAAYAAAITAGLVALKQAVFAVTLPVFPNLWADLLARMGWTFLQTGVTLMAAEGFDWADLSAWQGVAISGGAAVLTLLKGFLANRAKDDTVTPASLVSPGTDQPLPVAV